MKFLWTKITMVMLAVAVGQIPQSCEEHGNVAVPLTETEVVNGLKEALKVGIANAVDITSEVNGYYENELIKIPWPEEASEAYNYIDDKLPVVRPVLDEVILKMNRGAEKAAVAATPIFTDAITSMTIADAWAILKGDENAATEYLRSRTFDQLHASFKPEISASLESVGAASAWQEVTSAYNPVARLWPGIDPINTDLPDYATRQALDGLFLLIAEEEAKIRTNPQARINDILKRVFGSVDNSAK